MKSPTLEKNNAPGENESVRVDKWLWAVRLFKTRQAAADACRLQRVTIDGQKVKASRDVRVGEVIEVEQEDLTRTVRVRAVLEKRVGAKLAPEYVEDLTPPEEYESARRKREERSLNRLASPPRRPEKRDRRLMEAFLEQVRNQAEALGGPD